MGNLDTLPSNTKEGSKRTEGGSRAKTQYLRLATWRAQRKESSTVEGRKRKEGETRGRKKSIVGV